MSAIFLVFSSPLFNSQPARVFSIAMSMPMSMEEAHSRRPAMHSKARMQQNAPHGACSTDSKHRNNRMQVSLAGLALLDSGYNLPLWIYSFDLRVPCWAWSLLSRPATARPIRACNVRRAKQNTQAVAGGSGKLLVSACFVALLCSILMNSLILDFGSLNFQK